MTRNRIGSGITARLMALVVLTMSPVFVLFLTASSRERARATELAEGTLRADATSAVRRLENVATEVERFLATIALVPEIREAGDPACSLLLGASKIDRRYMSLALVDADGGYLCQTLNADTEGVSVADRAWVRGPLDEGEATRQVIRSGRLSGATVLILSHPVHDEAGKVIGVLGGGLDLEGLVRASGRSPHDFSVGFADPEGLLAMVGELAPSIPPQMVESFLASGQDESQIRIEAEETWLGVLARAPGISGLAAVAIASETELFGQLRRDGMRNLALLLLVTAFSLGGAWFASRRLIGQPLDRIGRAVEALGGGRLDARSGVTTGPLELQRLAAAFDQMARALELRDAEIKSAHAQLEATHEQLAHAQKMEAVGQLTGGIAHDFNNLLTVIKGCLGLLDSTRLPEEDRGLIAQAVVASDRGVELTSRLLAFSRRQHLSPARMDLNELVLGMRSLLTRTLGDAIRVEYDLADTRPKCVADANQLESALLNLVLNSRDAMPGGGRITVGTEWCDVDDATALDLSPGRYAVLWVGDEGVGMTPEVAARAAEPFFTTKDRGRGTGLGLSGAYGFTQQSGGTLRITSAEHVGTTVSIFLPAHRVGESAADVGATPDDARSRRPS